MEFENIDELNQFLQGQMDQQNRTPVPAMDNLCPLDMQQLLYSPFGPDSPLQFHSELSDETGKQIPFYQLVRDYLGYIRDAPKQRVRLTQNGNLPVKLVRWLYERGRIQEDMIEQGWQKLYKQADSISITNLYHVVNIAGITKKRHSYLSLTKKGERLLEKGRERELFQLIFTTHAQKFNLALHDGYDDDSFVQSTIGFLLYLLLRYGETQRSLDFYVQKNLLAFPMLYDIFGASPYFTPESQFLHCLWNRLFERFLDHYGFIDYEADKQHNRVFLEIDSIRLQTTPAFRNVFRLDKRKFNFVTPGSQA